MTNVRHMRGRKASMGRVATFVGALAIWGSVEGCAVTDGDVKRWETTERGPEKLAAVVKHAKYKPELRVGAAEALIRMKPRSGKRIGIDSLLATLAELSDGERAAVTGPLVSKLVEAMAAERPARNPDGTWPADPSVPFKDAAFGLVSHEPPLVGDEEGARQKLLAAFGAFYEGKKSDVALLEPFKGDKMPVSKCAEADECGWVCDFPAGDPKAESKTIGTVGDFVTFCVIPSMTSN